MPGEVWVGFKGAPLFATFHVDLELENPPKARVSVERVLVLESRQSD